MSGPAWTWRHAILEAELPATTKHVLLTISCFMNDVGEGSIARPRSLLSLSVYLTHFRHNSRRHLTKPARSMVLSLIFVTASRQPVASLPQQPEKAPGKAEQRLSAG